MNKTDWKKEAKSFFKTTGDWDKKRFIHERLTYHSQYLLSQLVFFPEMRAYICSELNESHFCGWYRNIFKAIKKLHQKGKEITILSIYDFLNGKVPASFIASLSEGAIPLQKSSVDYSIKTLKELRRRYEH